MSDITPEALRNLADAELDLVAGGANPVPGNGLATVFSMGLSPPVTYTNTSIPQHAPASPSNIGVWIGGGQGYTANPATNPSNNAYNPAGH